MITWASWCTRHWLLSAATLMLLVLASGVLPSPRDIVPQLANQPEVRTAFADPAFGSQDAMIFLFSFLFLGPFAGFIALLLAAVVLAALGGVFVPIGQKVGLPEWVSTAAFLVALGTYIYVKTDVWVPPSMWFLGLVAKSWLIVHG
jgi:hypothetical protein